VAFEAKKALVSAGLVLDLSIFGSEEAVLTAERKEPKTKSRSSPGYTNKGSQYILLIMAFLVLGNLIPLWSFPYFPSFDHPSHLLRQNILANYDNPQFDYSQNFEVQFLPVPNSLPDYVIAFLAFLVPVDIASKMLYSLYVILFPSSLLYFLRVTRPANDYLALFGCLFTYNFFLLVWGNENFCFSIPLFFIAFAYWWSHQDKLRLPSYALLSVLCTALYLSHILGFAIFTFSVFIASLFLSRSMRKSVSALMPTFFGMALYGWWNLKRGEYFDNPITWDLSIGKKVHSLLEPIAFHQKIGFSLSFQLAILTYFVIYTILLFLTFIRRDTKPGTRSLASTFLALLLVAFVIPEWFILFGADKRIFLVTFLFGLPLLFVPPRSVKTSLTLFLTILSLGHSLVIFGYFGEQNKHLSAYKTALDHIPPFQKLLPLVLPPYTYWPSYHRFFEYYHLERGGINPFHATQPIFSVTYVERPPSGGIYDVHPRDLSFDILSYYDFVLIVGNKDKLGQSLEKHLQYNGYSKHYEQGMYSIFERKTGFENDQFQSRPSH
jgi:hypothetical protein